MSEGALRCQGCGAPLPHAEAVCTRCEQELSGAPAMPTGPYVCPQCHGRFATLARALWPPKVPWYRPTTMRLQCPHCATPLRERHEPPWLRRLALVVLVLAIGLQLFASGRLRLLIPALMLAGLFGPLLWAAWKGRRDPHRYVVGIRRFWAQGPDVIQSTADGGRRPGTPP